MGASIGEFRPGVARDSEEDERTALCALDCKDYARALMDQDPKRLTVVRGYAVLGRGFTEHWWCVTDRHEVVDVTNMRALKNRVPKYVPLDEDGPIFSSLCDAMVGECEAEGEDCCAWCAVRYGLEAKGLKRLSLPILGERIVHSLLWEENRRLRADLARAIEAEARGQRQVDISRTCSACGGRGYFAERDHITGREGSRTPCGCRGGR